MAYASFNAIAKIGPHAANAALQNLYWLQDNAASTVVVDSSGNGRDGTCVANTNSKTTAGPNAWLTAALDFNGTTDRISLPNDITAVDQTLFGWVKSDEVTPTDRKWFGQGNGTANGQAFDWTSEGGCRLRHGGGNVTYGSASGSAWNCIVAVIPAAATTTNNITVRINGASAAATRTGGSNQSLAIATNGPYIGDAGVTGYLFDGKIAGIGRLSVALTSTEADEIPAGPEPVNTVAPVLSGTETEGQTLSCTSGTWGLPSPFSGGSNGTITYSYQWTRSDDGSGTGEANISGATSSTYTLQAGDVGKYVRCWVRGTNNGGADVAADTASNFSGAIASAGGSPYSLTAGAASFSFAGQDASLRSARNLTCSGATFSVSGQDAAFSATRVIAGGAGSFIFTGQDAALRAGGTLAFEVGAFSVSGQDATLDRTRSLDAGAGQFQIWSSATIGPGYQLHPEAAAFILTGQSADLERRFSLSADVGSFVATGGPASLIISGRRMQAFAGSFSLTGLPAAFTRGRKITAAVGSFTLSGQTATLRRRRGIYAEAGAFSLVAPTTYLIKSGNQVMPAGAGAFTLTGQPAALRPVRNLVSSAGAFVLSGQDATITRTWRLRAWGDSYLLTGQAVGLARGKRITAEAAAFLLSGIAVDLKHGRKVTAAAAAFVLSGQAATLRAGRIPLEAGAGSFSLTGNAAGLSRTVRKILAADVGSFTLAGQSAGLAIGYRIAASAGAFIHSGISAGLIAARTVQAGAGSFSLSGVAARLAVSRTMSAAVSTYSLSGQAAGLRASRRTVAAAGAFVVTGRVARLTPGSGNRRSPFRSRIYHSRIYKS